MPEIVTPPTLTRFVGCDVGKATIVVFDSRDGRCRIIANTPEALAAFAESLDAACLVVCEATGGYEDALLAALLVAGIPAHRADAARSRHSSARSAPWARATPSMPVRSPATPRSATPVCPWQAPDPQRERLQTWC